MTSSDCENRFAQGLKDYIFKSPSPYHASANIAECLNVAGFERLDETHNWHLNPNGKYYVVRNDTSIVAFSGSTQSCSKRGVRIVAAHLDSPCLKVTPNPVVVSHGYEQINVEVYGSALLRTWFDRDLSIAGRVFYKNDKAQIHRGIINFQRPMAFIPSIAIHLQRDANERQEIDKQTHLNPMVATTREIDGNNFHHRLLQHVENELKVSKIEQILGFDLSLYDVNPPRTLGSDNEFLASARIDNLVSCYAGLRAFLDADGDNFCILVCSDHEEVGSLSDSGAQSGFLASVLERLPSIDSKVMRQSYLVSADGAHGIHPNYPQKHDQGHAPVLNNGVVLKVNSNQRYATTGETLSVMRNLGDSLGISLQVFASRNNIPCGTTIGPIVASEIGIKTVDLGVAQFAMHSIREIAGCNDLVDFKRLLEGFYKADTVAVTD